MEYKSEARTNINESCSEKIKIKKARHIQKITWCGVIIFLNHFIVYISSTLYNGVTIAKQTPISKCFSIVFIVLPFTLCISIMVSKLISNYDLVEILEYALITFGTVFFVLNMCFVFFSDYFEADLFFAKDLLSEEKLFFKGRHFFPVLISLCSSWTITLSFTIIYIYDTFVQYVLMLSFWNQIFTQKQYFNFTSVIIFSDTVALLLSSMISFLHHYLLSELGFGYKSIGIISFLIFMVILSIILFLIFRTTTKKVLDLKNIEDSGFIGLRISEIEDKKDATKSIASLFQSRFVKAVGAYIVVFFILYEFLNLSFETSILSSNSMKFGGKEQFSSNLVIANISIVRFISSITILAALFFSIPKWLIKHNWEVLIYSGCTWGLLGCIIQFTLDTILKASENEGFSFFRVSCKMSKLFGDNNSQIILYRIHAIISMIIMIFLRFFRFIGFFIAKEILISMIDKKTRVRLRTIYDGLCPLIGRAIASAFVLVCTEIFNFRDLRSFSPLLLLFSVTVFLFWIRDTRYLVRRYQDAS